MTAPHSPLHVSLVATPDAQVSPLSGLYETFGAFGLLADIEPGVPAKPFRVEIVAPDDTPLHGASGLPLGVHRTCLDIKRTDIVIVPLMMVNGLEWQPGRYPALVDWLRRMHAAGASLCSACTGVLLLAETGLLDGREATLHWAFGATFRRNFPRVKLRTEEVLITAGERKELVMTGGVMSWHDLALHLIARHVGPSAAQSMARLLMLQWHGDGQAPYTMFTPAMDHGDALIRHLQAWIAGHFAEPDPVANLVQQASVPRRSLERRFARATGLTPLAYVQQFRIEQAKRQLERTCTAVEDISVAVGYENASFFRRVFKRHTRMTPGAYRRRFTMHGINESP